MTTLETAPTAERVDPITFEIIRHKLDQVVEEAIDALKNVSGSPTTNEGHDMMVSLYRADGGLMIGGVGFLHHLTSAAQAVRHILDNFSDDPGIDEGDVWMLNDSYTAALHPPDIYIMSPVFYEGRLRGFVSNFVHATDIGAVDAGGFSPNAKNAFHEGFVTKGLKIVERGRFRRDVVETYLNQVREPGLVALDLRSQLAANHAAAERLLAMYREYTPEVVDAVSDELIRQSEELLRRRLRELPDGSWRMRQYVDWPDKLHKVELSMTKTEDRLVFDFAGTDEQSVLGVNDSYWSTLGAVFAPIYPLLAWDMTWNEGLMGPVEVRAPEGTLVNCRRPAPISIATVAMIKVVNDMASLLIGRMLDASPQYHDRAMAVWDGSHSAISMIGETEAGEPFIGYSTDAFAGSGGARADRDGIDIGGEIPNGVSRWANAETHELNAPIQYLYRRAVVDSGGPGKYRGGLTHEFAIAQHKAKDGRISLVLTTKGLRSPLSIGLSGGFPGCTTGSRIFRDANVDEMPDDLGSTRGNAETADWGDYELGPSDIFYHRFQGGGGYGDPLDRAPDAVGADVAAGLVSAAAAREVYGVVLDDSGRADPSATRTRRREIRTERLGRVVDEGVLERAAVPASGRPISEYLQRTDDGVQCTWCGHELVSGERPWIEGAHVVDLSLSAAGPLREGAPGMVLRMAACPTCATALRTDVALADDEHLCDHVVRWPAPEDGSA